MGWDKGAPESFLNRADQSLEVDWEDDEAARLLVERLRPRLLREIDRQVGNYLRRRIDQEDILQSTFCSFFRRARDGQYQFDHSMALCRMLQTIAENKIRKAAVFHTRHCRDVRQESGTAVDELELGDGVWQQEQTQVQAMIERIGLVVDRLPQRDAEFFRRRYVEGHTVGKISVDTGWSVSTVRRVLSAVRWKIQDSTE
jgi:RNA polymerase sigma factor (sigma-70 family)